MSAPQISDRDRLSDVLRRIRMEAKLSQKEMASRLRVTPQYLCDLEKNRRMGSVDFIELLCKEFGNGPQWRRTLHVITARGHGWDV